MPDPSGDMKQSRERKLWPVVLGLFLLFHGIHPIRDGWFGDGIFRGLDPWVETLWWNLVGTTGGVLLLFGLGTFSRRQGLYCECGYDLRGTIRAGIKTCPECGKDI